MFGEIINISTSAKVLSVSYIGVLNTVRELTGKLNSDEKASIRLYLGLFVEKGKLSRSKSIRLFDIICADKYAKLSDDDIELMIYEKSNPKTFAQLVLRLRNKILEGLLLDVNIDREGAYPEKIKVNIEIRKNITQAQILQNRGARIISESMFARSVEQAKKYELYDELLLALRLLIKQKSATEGDRQINSLLKQYEKYDYAKSAVMLAEVNHRRVNAEVDFRANQNLDSIWLKSVLDSMRKDYKRTGSAQIGYYYFLLEAQYFQHNGNYKNARKSLLNNQRLVELSAAMNTPLNLSTVILNLADNDLYLRQFERSFITSQDALSLLKKDNFNYNQGLIVMFYSRYYSGRYNAALNLLTEIFPEKSKTDNFWNGRRMYFIANTYFMLGDFQNAVRNLNIINPIENDKEGWNTYFRILTIMSHVELNQFDEAASKTEALRKFLFTLEKEHPRTQIIFSILQSLSSAGFVFKAAFQKEKQKIELLEKSMDVKWQIKSPEMVIFHQWFESKVFKQNFSLKIPPHQNPELSKTDQI